MTAGERVSTYAGSGVVDFEVSGFVRVVLDVPNGQTGSKSVVVAVGEAAARTAEEIVVAGLRAIGPEGADSIAFAVLEDGVERLAMWNYRPAPGTSALVGICGLTIQLYPEGYALVFDEKDREMLRVMKPEHTRLVSLYPDGPRRGTAEAEALIAKLVARSHEDIPPASVGGLAKVGGGYSGIGGGVGGVAGVGGGGGGPVGGST